MFQFESSEGERFGDPMIGVIDIENVEGELESSDMPLQKSQSIRKSSYVNEDELYPQAHYMSEKGYGPFEKCLQMLKACKGNYEEATETISKLMLVQYSQQEESD